MCHCCYVRLLPILTPCLVLKRRMSRNLHLRRHFSFAFVIAALAGLPAMAAGAVEFGVSSFDASGWITWSNAFPAGVVTIECASTVTGPWLAGSNYFTTNSV